jgi:hypothetical protein
MTKKTPPPTYRWQARGRFCCGGRVKGGRWPEVTIEETGDRYTDTDPQEWTVRLFWGYYAGRGLPDELDGDKLPKLPKEAKATSRQAAKDKANAMLAKVAKKIGPWQAEVREAEDKAAKAEARKHRKREKATNEAEALLARIKACYPELEKVNLSYSLNVRIGLDVLAKLLEKLGMPAGDDPLVCAECGNDRVEQALWTVLNTGEINDAEGFGTIGNGGHYCGVCDGNEVTFVRKSKYQEKAGV